ncbi:cytochrome c5 [Beggiatoa alba B18LD]|uniref:Cytochrome c5 n=1 Tax=Beggiatoa alba B18LD TaxID=395493 RepID=I3CFK9_9GAMM|nr:c-type cytochrome [Beggiatoa alba]EIJ42402.1 cytochrome c5 [Beggiatoa alba B18LD]
MRNLALLLALWIIVAVSLVASVEYYLATPPEPAGAVELRVKPISAVNIGAVPVVAEAKDEKLAPGEKVYKNVCSACHATGALNAPKFGNKDDWAPRIAKGIDTLYTHAIGGFNTMPAKGGQAQLSDDEVKEAVRFMIGDAEGKKPEAAAEPAPATPAPAEAAKPAEEAKPAETAPAPQTEATKPAETTASTGAVDVSAYDLAKGEEVYKATCFACHDSGLAGAPKFADASAWKDRIAQGLDTMFGHALNGFQGKAGIMPPKGGSTASDDDIKAAVAFMVSKAQ